MKKIKFKKVIIIILSILTLASLIGCNVKDKENIISNDVSKDVKQQEDEVSNEIEKGNKLLNESKFEEAKKVYENAIAKDIVNKHSYIYIKDKYMEKSRFDDAFYIIKLAIDNKVDLEEMNKVLEEIKKNFKVNALEGTVYENETLRFPKTTSITINNEEKKVPIKWTEESVKKDKAGDYKYEGIVEQYGLSVTFNLKVKKSVTEKVIGQIVNISDNGGKSYIQFDKVEFYWGKDEGYEAYVKDAKKYGEKIISKDIFYSGYHVSNEKYESVDYEVPHDVVLLLSKPGDSKMVSKEVGYDEFVQYVEEHIWRFDKITKICIPNLFWVTFKNDKIVRVEQQFIP